MAYQKTMDKKLHRASADNMKLTEYTGHNQNYKQMETLVSERMRKKSSI